MHLEVYFKQPLRPQGGLLLLIMNGSRRERVRLANGAPGGWDGDEKVTRKVKRTFLTSLSDSILTRYVVHCTCTSSLLQKV